MELLALCIALVCLAVCFVAVVIYFGRTTWNSQRHESEMARLCITALLSRNADTMPIAASIAPPGVHDPLDGFGARAYTSPVDNHREVRVPLAPIEPDFDREEDLTG